MRIQFTQGERKNWFKFFLDFSMFYGCLNSLLTVQSNGARKQNIFLAKRSSCDTLSNIKCIFRFPNKLPSGKKETLIIQRNRASE